MRRALLPVPGFRDRRPVADRQSLALADGPRLGGDPRQSDRGAVDGRQPGGLQDQRLRRLGGTDGSGRRALRAQDRFSGAGHLQRAALDPVSLDGSRRRPRQPAWRVLRRCLRGDAPGGDLTGARPDPGVGQRPRGTVREGRGRGRVPRGRSVRQEAGPGGRALRADPRALHPLRAAGQLRPLAEDPALLLDLPSLQARHLPPAEGLHAVGAVALSLLAAEGLVMDFGGLRAVDGVSFQIEPGEVFTIIGPNGAGKTTIFNLVSRIYDPSAGRLVFDGEDITRVRLTRWPGAASRGRSR